MGDNGLIALSHSISKLNTTLNRLNLNLEYLYAFFSLYKERIISK